MGRVTRSEAQLEAEGGSGRHHNAHYGRAAPDPADWPLWHRKDVHAGASHQTAAAAAGVEDSHLHSLEFGRRFVHQGLPAPVGRGGHGGGQTVARLLPQAMGRHRQQHRPEVLSDRPGTSTCATSGGQPSRTSSSTASWWSR
uniref:(northern house mosquito) hypothetical protein n=1 Tax=Culex pipiens TaxID=7175 RepID=A0A8D8DKA2_CULPI